MPTLRLHLTTSQWQNYSLLLQTGSFGLGHLLNRATSANQDEDATLPKMKQNKLSKHLMLGYVMVTM